MTIERVGALQGWECGRGLKQLGWFVEDLDGAAAAAREQGGQAGLYADREGAVGAEVVDAPMRCGSTPPKSSHPGRSPISAARWTASCRELTPSLRSMAWTCVAMVWRETKSCSPIWGRVRCVCR